MRIYTRIEIDILSGELISSESYEYTGEVAHCKKGRDQVDQAAKGAGAIAGQATDVAGKAGAIAGQDQQIQSDYRGSADPFAKSLIPDATGKLSPYAASQFGEEKKQIGKTYGDLSQVGLRMLGNRGLAAPGSSASIINTANERAGSAETSAYNDAMQRSLDTGLAGIRYSQDQQALYDPNRPMGTQISALNAGTNARSTQGNAGAQRNRMGSTLGDIGTAVSGLAGIGAGL